MSQRQKQKSLLIDPLNILHFNVGNENIHMKKVKTSGSETSSTKNKPEKPSSRDLLIPSSANQKIYYSIVEKQSQSGVSFNNRLFFVKDQDSFGYMSKTDFSFQLKNAKQIVSLTQLRKIIPKGKILTLIFDSKILNPKQSDKLVEKKWVLRMKDKKMADSWTDIINYQVGQIPSRKTTVQKQLSSQELPRSRQQTYEKEETKEQKSIKISPYSKNNVQQEPIANQRLQQDYLSVYRTSPDKNNQSSEPKSPNISMQSPFKQIKTPKQNKQQKIEFSPQKFAANTYQKDQQSIYNSTSQKHSQKKQRYLNSSNKILYETQFLAQKSYLEQIEENFKLKIMQIKQKLIFPSFLNYFRPYLDLQNQNSINSDKITEIDRKFEDFIDYCEITSKQFIEGQIPLEEFRLSNRYVSQKQTLSRDKLHRQMAQKYKQLFGTNMNSKMQVQALTLLFQNILYIQLEDVDIIVPLIELKTLPVSQFNYQAINSSTNKICQNSLINEFQNQQKNLSFVYKQILKNKDLKTFFFIPMTCQVEYKGFKLFFRTRVNQNMFKPINVNDSKNQIQHLSQSRLTPISQQTINMQYLHQTLARCLFINPQVIENQNFFNIKNLWIKSNKYNNALILDQRSNKYVISFASILPYVNNVIGTFSSKQTVEERIFTKVHLMVGIEDLNQIKSTQNGSNISNFYDQQESGLSSSFKNNKDHSYSKKKQSSTLKLYNHQGTSKQNELQLKLYKQQIQKNIKQLAKKLDKFQLYVIHPLEFKEHLEEHSLNTFLLGRLNNEIGSKNSFVKTMIKSQIAAQCAKIIIYKKMQEVVFTQKYVTQQNKNKQNQVLQKSLVTLLNLILGQYQIKQAQLIWKVLTLHSQILYSCAISQKQIHKGYFILALVHKLNLFINPTTVTIQQIFKTQKFVLNAKPKKPKSTPSYIHSNFLIQLHQTNLQNLLKNKNYCSANLIKIFNLQNKQLPIFVKKYKILLDRINFILSQQITSFDTKFAHLNLYCIRSLNFSQYQESFELVEENKTFRVSRFIKQKQASSKNQISENNFCMYYKKKFKQFEHKLRQNVSFNLTQQIENYIKQVRIFYEYHPCTSDLLDFISASYVHKYQFSKALQFNKLSLSNMIAVCQGNSNHLRLALCFSNSGMIYKKMRKIEQALNQFKRSKHCLQTNQQAKSANYCVLLIHIAKLSLQNDGKINQALSNALLAQNVAQQEGIIFSHPQLMLQIFQTQNQIFHSQQFDWNSLKNVQNLNPQSRSQHYFQILQLLLRQDKLTENKQNHFYPNITLNIFQRFLRIILPNYFHSLPARSGQILMAYLCELTQSIAKKGGVNYANDKNNNELKQQDEEENHQIQMKFYPPPQKDSLLNNNGLSQSKKYQTSSVYNIFDALTYLKQLVYKGTFILQLSEYVDKAQQILELIRQQIKNSKSNISGSKSHSRSSSRMYLMSSKGVQSFEENNEHEESLQLQKLLNSSNQQGNQKYTLRQRNFDSFMRALLVILGEGFMLHIFQA